MLQQPRAGMASGHNCNKARAGPVWEFGRRGRGRGTPYYRYG